MLGGVAGSLLFYIRKSRPVPRRRVSQQYSVPLRVPSPAKKVTGNVGSGRQDIKLSGTVSSLDGGVPVDNNNYVLLERVVATIAIK